MTFDGFPTPTKNFFSMPNAITDIIANITNLAELKVIIYVIRHTWGFHEYGKPKAISVDEFMNGRRYANGARMDTGTGLSNHSVIDGLKRAVEHEYLICEIDSSDLARVKKSYSLKMANTNTAPGEESSPPETSAPGANSTASSADSSPSYAESSPGSEESAYRSEKDTLERHSRKTLEEKQGTQGQHREQEQPCADAQPAPASHAQSTLENTPYRPSQADSYSQDTTEEQDESDHVGDYHRRRAGDSAGSQGAERVTEDTNTGVAAGADGCQKPGEAEQDVLIERTAIPEMPLQSARWPCAETAVLVSEALRGKYYTDNQRANQVNAAKRMCKDFKGIERDQFEEIFADWVKWWRDNGMGLFTLAGLMARGKDREVRLQTSLDRLEVRRAKEAKRTNTNTVTVPKDSGMVLWYDSTGKQRMMTYAEADENGWNGGFGEFIQHTQYGRTATV